MTDRVRSISMCAPLQLGATYRVLAESRRGYLVEGHGVSAWVLRSHFEPGEEVMPQASEEDRDRAEQLFGHRISDEGPIAYLETRGWVLTGDYCWRKPSKHYDPTDSELFAISFLIDEWDYGGIEPLEGKGNG